MKASEIKEGMKLKVIRDSFNHGYPIGSIVTVVGIYCNNGFNSIQVSEGPNYVSLKDVEKSCSSLNDILIAINLLEQEKQELETKRAFMMDVCAVSFDEDEFRAYQCLKTLENSDLSTYEKAKKIVTLLK